MRLSLAVSTALTAATTIHAQALTDSIPPVAYDIPTPAGVVIGSSTVGAALVSTASSSSSGISTSTSSNSITFSVGTAVYFSGSSSLTSSFITTAVSGSGSTSSDLPFGQTLSNGAYVCNPAHSYPGLQSCDGSGATPTLVTLSSAVTGSVSSTTAKTNSTTISMTYSAIINTPIATWTGAAHAKVIPVVGALVLGAIALVV